MTPHPPASEPPWNRPAAAGASSPAEVAALARLDRLIARTEQRVAEQQARIGIGYGTETMAEAMRRFLTLLRLDLEIYRHSREAIAEAYRVMALSAHIVPLCLSLRQ